jgi:hypothetical protein
MSYKLVIPGELPTLNNIINKSKTHWAVYSKMKKKVTEDIAILASQLPALNRIYLIITYYRRNKGTDPDNIAAGKKFIFDGLVTSGAIKNDGWKEVAGWEERFAVDKKNPRTEIEIIDQRI